MSYDAIPDETTTDTDADEQESWVMIEAVCEACNGLRITLVTGQVIGTDAQVEFITQCLACGGSGRVLRRERSGQG